MAKDMTRYIPAKNTDIETRNVDVMSPELFPAERLIEFGIAFSAYCNAVRQKIGIARLSDHLEARSTLLQEGVANLWEGVQADFFEEQAQAPTDNGG